MPVSTRPTGTVPIPPILDILEGQTKGLVCRSGGWIDGVQSLQKGGAVGLALLPLDGPSLVPAHVGGWLQHVVAMPPGDGDKGDGGWVVADLLDEARHLLLDLLEPGSGVGRLGGVHLVDSHDELLHTEGVGEQGVLTGLAVLGDAGLELTSANSNDQDTAIGLRCS